MAPHDMIVVGASAGGIEALNELVQGLPENLPASLFVAVHFPSWGTSYLPQILARVSPLPVSHARDGETIQPGRIYLAPPDYHLILQNGSMHLVHSPREHGFRPAIDPLFRSAASAYASRVTGIILSGSLSDGAAGLSAIQRPGGLTIVQDPEEALFSSMPLSALDRVRIDYVLPVRQIATTISSLAGERVDLEPKDLEGANWMADLHENEADFVQGDI